MKGITDVKTKNLPWKYVGTFRIYSPNPLTGHFPGKILRYISLKHVSISMNKKYEIQIICCYSQTVLFVWFCQGAQNVCAELVSLRYRMWRRTRNQISSQNILCNELNML